MGTFYIHDAVPMKGAKPDSEGKMMYMLQCFAIADDATVASIESTTHEQKNAQYRVYYGHVSRFKGDAGITVGHVYDCYGSDGFHFASADARVTGRVMTDADGVCLPRPRVMPDTDSPRYGSFNARIQSYDEQIATEAAVTAARASKQTAITHPRPRIY